MLLSLKKKYPETSDHIFYFINLLTFQRSIQLPFTEDGDSKLIQNVSKYLQDYTTSHPRRQYEHSFLLSSICINIGLEGGKSVGSTFVIEYLEMIFYNSFQKVSQIFIAVQCSFNVSSVFLYNPHRRPNGHVETSAQFMMEKARTVSGIACCAFCSFSKSYKKLHNSYYSR
jgi:hypothetical protein